MKQSARMSTHAEAIDKDRVGDAAEPDKLLHAVKTECSVHRKHACLTHKTHTMDAMPSALAEMRMVQCNARAFNHQHQKTTYSPPRSWRWVADLPFKNQACKEKSNREWHADMSSMMLLSGRYTLQMGSRLTCRGVQRIGRHKTILEGRGIMICTRPYLKEVQVCAAKTKKCCVLPILFSPESKQLCKVTAYHLPQDCCPLNSPKSQACLSLV